VLPRFSFVARFVRLLPLALVAAFAFGVPTSASNTLPEGGGANNIVISRTTNDGELVVRSSLQVSTMGGPSVTSANIAAAASTACTGCSTTAVAVQIVLVSGTPWHFAPGNFAGATNASCSHCGAFAYAWQYVPQVSRTVTLTPEARERVAELRQEIADTAASYDPKIVAELIAMDAALDRLTAKLKSVVDGAIIEAGATADGEPVTIAEATPPS
jgi:hypothetical protein